GGGDAGVEGGELGRGAVVGATVFGDALVVDRGAARGWPVSSSLRAAPRSRRSFASATSISAMYAAASSTVSNPRPYRSLASFRSAAHQRPSGPSSNGAKILHCDRYPGPVVLITAPPSWRPHGPR